MCDDLWCLEKHAQDSEKSTPTDLRLLNREELWAAYKKATLMWIILMQLHIYVADLNLTQLQTQKVAKNLHLNEAVQLEYYRQARISLSHVLLYFCELIERQCWPPTLKHKL